MTKKGNVNKDRLKDRWLATYKALTQLENLHVWPVGIDIAGLEGALISELDSIERELGQDLYDRA